MILTIRIQGMKKVLLNSSLKSLECRILGVMERCFIPLSASLNLILKERSPYFVCVLFFFLLFLPVQRAQALSRRSVDSIRAAQVAQYLYRVRSVLCHKRCRKRYVCLTFKIPLLVSPIRPSWIRSTVLV